MILNQKVSNFLGSVHDQPAFYIKFTKNVDKPRDKMVKYTALMFKNIGGEKIANN